MGESAGELWFISNTLSLTALHHDLGCWCINGPVAFHQPWNHSEPSVLPVLSSSPDFRLEGATEFPAGFIGPGCMVSNSGGLEWDLRIHISNQCSSDSGQPWTIIWESVAAPGVTVMTYFVVCSSLLAFSFLSPLCSLTSVSGMTLQVNYLFSIHIWGSASREAEKETTKIYIIILARIHMRTSLLREISLLVSGHTNGQVQPLTTNNTVSMA